MKERIVIEGKEPKEVIIKLVKASSIKMYEELERTDRICIYGEELKRIKVPETFEELKDLCKGKFAEISEHSIMIFGMLDFFDDGTLTFHNYCEIANDLTPQQMYQIIKSLIGEE